MSKQIAILLDNSGSMFNPVGGSNPNTKIYETARGAEFFIQNLIDELVANPGAELALSVHRFASSYQILPGGAQISSSQANFNTALNAMRSAISAIENESASSAAVGSTTDLFGALHAVSDYLNNPANQPGFGAPDRKVVFLFTDGLQTVAHGGSKTLAGYETALSVTFENLLEARGLRLIAWGSGTDALGEVLAELAGKAVQGGTSPVSASKVLFPVDEDGVFENCTAIIATNAIEIVSNNGILPLRPVGEPASDLLWEQFSLPEQRPVPIVLLAAAPTQAASAAPPGFIESNVKDFEVDVDGSTKELILALVTHARRGVASLQASAPDGTVFTASSAGARAFSVENAWALKVPNPAEGTWRVRVTGNPRGTPQVLDLMARGVQKRFSLETYADPRHILQAGKVHVVAWPRWDGEPAEGKLQAQAHVLGGGTFPLTRSDDGAFRGPVQIDRPGVSIIAVRVEGVLRGAGTLKRVAFATVLLGAARDPRFALTPDTYEQGHEYSVAIRLVDARFLRSTQLRFGSGIDVLEFEMLSHTAAQARIRIAADARLGAREVVSYHPQAEGIAPVTVIQGNRDPVTPSRICCLRFDARGRLVAIVLCDGQEVRVCEHDGRLHKLLEHARDAGLSVHIHRDARGCLCEVEICR